MGDTSTPIHSQPLFIDISYTYPSVLPIKHPWDEDSFDEPRDRRPLSARCDMPHQVDMDGEWILSKNT
jgi:hypothetical protein